MPPQLSALEDGEIEDGELVDELIPQGGRAEKPDTGKEVLLRRSTSTSTSSQQTSDQERRNSYRDLNIIRDRERSERDKDRVERDRQDSLRISDRDRRERDRDRDKDRHKDYYRDSERFRDTLEREKLVSELEKATKASSFQDAVRNLDEVSQNLKTAIKKLDKFLRIVKRKRDDRIEDYPDYATRILKGLKNVDIVSSTGAARVGLESAKQLMRSAWLYRHVVFSSSQENEFQQLLAQSKTFRSIVGEDKDNDKVCKAREEKLDDKGVVRLPQDREDDATAAKKLGAIPEKLVAPDGKQEPGTRAQIAEAVSESATASPLANGHASSESSMAKRRSDHSPVRDSKRSKQEDSTRPNAGQLAADSLAPTAVAAAPLSDTTSSAKPTVHQPSASGTAEVTPDVINLTSKPSTPTETPTVSVISIPQTNGEGPLSPPNIPIISHTQLPPPLPHPLDPAVLQPDPPHIADDLAAFRPDSSPYSMDMSDQDTAGPLADDPETLIQSGKLCLVLDLDHTLLNSIRFSDMEPTWELALQKRVSQEASTRPESERELFRLPRMGMWTKLRPGVRQFLQAVHPKFQLWIHTNGNRSYAQAMAELLDPTKEYFEDRIIAQGHAGQAETSDNLQAKRLMQGLEGKEPITLILDDSSAVWPHDPRNLFVVERYLYFPCGKRRGGGPGKSLLETGRDELVELGMLMTALTVIDKAHRTMFQSIAALSRWDPSQRSCDVRNILDAERRSILAGVHIVFSRVIPTEQPPETHALWQLAVSFGAKCSAHYTSKCTHMVSTVVNTEKVARARADGKYIVLPHWLECSCTLWNRADEHMFPVTASG